MSGLGDFLKDPVGWLTGQQQAEKARDAANEIAAAANATQVQYTREAMKQYMDYLDKALGAGKEGQQQAIATQLAGGQAALDLARQGAAQKMSWALPTQAASLSALQALPQMQTLLGMPAYNLPTTIDTTTPSSVNLAGLYQNALSAGQGVPTGPGSMGTPVAGAGSPASSYALTPYTGKTIDVTASPLFQWQNKQMQENVNRSLAARGYGSSPAAAAILADEYSKLTGAETEKLYNRLQNMVNLGAGMPGATGGTAAGTEMAGATGNLASNLSSIYNQAAATRAGLYEGAGQTLASGNIAMGTAAGNLGQQQAQNALSSVGQSPLSTALQLYSLYGGLTGAGALGAGGTMGSALKYPSYSGPYALPSLPTR